jgi:two-component system LytT family sensor kinase
VLSWLSDYFGTLDNMTHSKITHRLMLKTSLRKWILATLIGIFLSTLFYSYLHFSETGRFPSFRTNTPGFICSAFFGIITACALYQLNIILDKFIPWKNRFSMRFILGYIANTLLALAIVFSLGGIMVKTFSTPIFWETFTLKDEDLVMKVIIILLTSVFIYKIVYGLLYSYQHYAIAQIENLQNERKQLELQFEALKGQVSPHYLFNSLNTISSLLFKDLPSAEQFIRRLAQTYQYILATQHKQFVLLTDEVEFVKSYYYLLRIRFQQQLDVEINLPSGIMNSKIPPLTLQMLVENAVKHNSLTSDKKLLIYITAQDNTYVKVINTKTGVLDSVASFKVGLENIRKRYRYFTDANIEVKDDEKFTVSLPVIPNRGDHLEQKHSA